MSNCFNLWNVSKTCSPVANEATQSGFVGCAELSWAVEVAWTYTQVRSSRSPTLMHSELCRWDVDRQMPQQRNRRGLMIQLSLLQNRKQWCLHVCVVWELSADVGWLLFFFFPFCFWRKDVQSDCQLTPRLPKIPFWWCSCKEWLIARDKSVDELLMKCILCN